MCRSLRCLYEQQTNIKTLINYDKSNDEELKTHSVKRQISSYIQTLEPMGFRPSMKLYWPACGSQAG